MKNNSEFGFHSYRALVQLSNPAMSVGDFLCQVTAHAMALTYRCLRPVLFVVSAFGRYFFHNFPLLRETKKYAKAASVFEQARNESCTPGNTDPDSV